MYLPPAYTHETEFPHALDKDLRFQIRLIEEKWRRFFPQIEYYAFNGRVVPTANPSGQVEGVVGESDGSAFDTLYGETVDAAQLATGTWQQPHNATGVAANPELFYPVQLVHAQIRREAKEKELKKYGFDQIRDLLVTIPTSLLDALAITCRPGDQFVWDGARYTVLQQEATGYWKNTNIRLYVVLNCEHARSGS